jgi:hypothetical protein
MVTPPTLEMCVKIYNLGLNNQYLQLYILPFISYIQPDNGKIISIKHYRWLSAIVIRHANYILSAPYYVCIVICDLTGSTIFVHVTPERHYFRKKVIEHETCRLIFSITFV